MFVNRLASLLLLLSIPLTVLSVPALDVRDDTETESDSDVISVSSFGSPSCSSIQKRQEWYVSLCAFYARFSH